MARPKETLTKRIARHTGKTEEELIDFLDRREEGYHLMWSGAFNPKVRKTHVIKRKFGLPYTTITSPHPVMWHDGTLRNPKRLLFEHVHNITLDPEVELRSTCGAYGCISPFHQRMLATYSRRWERFAKLPDLTPNQVEEEDPFENVPTIMYMLRNFPENVQGFPPEAVEEAKRRLAEQDTSVPDAGSL